VKWSRRIFELVRADGAVVPNVRQRSAVLVIFIVDHLTSAFGEAALLLPDVFIGG
jgi:hypothetical protein